MEIFKPVKLKHKNILEYLFRSISGPIARRLARTKITPNQVTLSRVPLMIFVFYQFAVGEFPNLAIASVGLIVGEILDVIDGDLAFIKNQCSTKGVWLEEVTDRIFFCVLDFLSGHRCFIFRNCGLFQRY